jgi:hypothetical protein
MKGKTTRQSWIAGGRNTMLVAVRLPTGDVLSLPPDLPEGMFFVETFMTFPIRLALVLKRG